MSAEIRQAGDYRGHIFEYGLIEKKDDKGNAAGLSLAVKISCDEVWMPAAAGEEPQWLDCSGWDAHGSGFLVLVTKQGKLNESQVRPLMKFAGWDGSLEALASKTWEPKPIRFDVTYETFNNAGKYRVNFISDYESVPGVMGNVDADRAKQLAGQFGSQIRALMGNASRAATPPPAGKPAAPATTARRGRTKAAAAPPPTDPNDAAANAAFEAANPPKDEIPF